LQQRGEKMTLQVVDPDEGHAPGERVGLGGGKSDQQRSNETRTTGDGDPENLGIEGVESGLGERPANYGADGGDVGATGQFRHDATKGPMLIDGGLDHRGKNVKVLVDDGGRRFVTTRLDSEHQSHQSSVGGAFEGSVERSAQRIKASSLLFS